MKILAILVLTGIVNIAHAQSNETDSTGLPGDNFSLQGALELFKKSSSPEEFEKLLNADNNDVNNLDLNEDGEVDYVRVIDKMDKDAHAIILQVPVSSSENQDVAVIEIEKTGEEKATLQIIGDESLYGEEKIIEPVAENNKADDAFINDFNSGGPYVDDIPLPVFVNVWFWPSVRFIYRPAYTVWVSPWGWRRYPGWYRPWRPVAWRVFYPRRVVYYNRFVVVNNHRVIRAHNIYRPVRVTSVMVRTRTQPRVSAYRTTRRTTVVRHNRGGRRAVIHQRSGSRPRRR
jgi:hypothetical protein